VALPVPPSVVAPSPSTEERYWRFAAHATLSVTLGALPDLGIGVDAGAALLLSRLHFALAAAVYPMRSTTLDGGGAGGDVWLAFGSAWGGYAVLLEPVNIALGVGLEVGVMSAEGFGVPEPDSGAGVWLMPYASGVGFVPIALPLGLRFELAVGIPVFRPPFVLEGLGQVHQASPVIGRISLGPELRF
jgi:hypothetical protein